MEYGLGCSRGSVFQAAIVGNVRSKELPLFFGDVADTRRFGPGTVQRSAELNRKGNLEQLGIKTTKYVFVVRSEGCHVRLPPGFLSPFQMVRVESPEGRRVAHNASSRRSYARHRNSINQKRRDNYRKKKSQRHGCRLEPLIRQATRLVEIEVNSCHSHNERCSLLAETMDKIERLSIKFALITHGSLKLHANAVYQLYQKSITANRPKGYRSVLDSAVLEISSIEDSILQHEHIILNTAGVGKEMRRLRVILDPVHTLFKGKYLKGELAFQM
ncbi:hypothetical protein IW261DRAFT_1421688 [Armillaria novae-zelandiae]|uniref:Uncharacterized protein n=1 Tax=Armillaria novae-zelandiae TaxID=153914 RepID=A0AA39P3M3_9AGAR|nr:hypothetical protein IW261DRAFT_1421688 [Armillaria novae-zelandiae]